MNVVILKGNITSDIDIKNSGKTYIANFGLAVKDNNSKEDRTDFVNVVAFNKQAEALATYVKKGDPLLVKGRLRIEEYKDKNGESKKAVKIITDEIEFLYRKPTEKQENSSSDINDEDAPF